MRLCTLDGVVGETALLSVPHEYAKDIVEQRLRPVITTTLTAQLGHEIRIAVVVDPSLEDAEPPRDGVPGSEQSADPTTSSPTRPPIWPATALMPRRRTGRPRTGCPRRGRRRLGPARRRRSGRGPRRHRARARAASGERAHPAEPALPVRDLRHRVQQPVRPRGCGCRRRGAGQGLQPAVHLRRLGAGQDPPAARHRPLRDEPLQRGPGALRQLRGVHQRLHQLHPGRAGRRIPPALPRRGHPARRRHPVPGEQGADAGGVLPHVQHAAQREQADRDLQ